MDLPETDHSALARRAVPAQLFARQRPTPMAEENKSVLPRWLQIVLIGRRPRNTALRIAILVPVVFLTARFFLWPIRVQGPSMQPTYRENGINFLNRLAYLFHE